MYTYPLKLSFKLVALAPEVNVTDATGQTVLHLKQKLLSWKESVKVYADSNQQKLAYQINSDSLVNFSANYRLRDGEEQPIGTVQRQGMRSLWKATYNVLDAQGQDVGLIHERNPWVKVLDALLGEIPFVGFLVVLLFNPAYVVELRGTPVLLLKKLPSLFARSFSLEQTGTFPDSDESLLLASVLTMLLHERRRE